MTKIESSHGAGGKIMQQLLENYIIPSFKLRRTGPIGLDEMDDGASLQLNSTDLIVTTDAHTVQPLFFPGGDIGKLSACGTINDVCMMGARPVAMTNTIVVEEGFEIETLRQILFSINAVIEPLGVAMIAGDTKVMPRGKLDGLVLSTTGIGVVYGEHAISDSGARVGDDIIITGPIGDHGAALLAHREGMAFKTDLVSDVAPLWEPIRDCLDIGGIHAMKDPTRGGTAVALNEIASKSRVDIELQESLIPVRPAVRAFCDILGLNPMNLSCEGRAVIVVDPKKTDEILKTLRRHPVTSDAQVVGHTLQGPGRVTMRTTVGGRKFVQVPQGEPIPRVC